MTLCAESPAYQTKHIADAFVRKNVAHDFDILMTFESLQSTSFCLEKSSIRKWIFECLNSLISANLVGIT